MNEPAVDIKALAQLARLDVPEGELAQLEKEIPDILKFIETIQGADVSGVKAEHQLRNVMREDGEPHETGKYAEKLLDAAPSKEKDRFAVKQVISRKKQS